MSDFGVEGTTRCYPFPADPEIPSYLTRFALGTGTSAATYLETADRLADLLKERTAPVPVSATTREFGLPGAHWLAAQRSGARDVLESTWPPPQSGPSTAHYLLLALIHHICQPGPKTEVADWYRSTICSASVITGLLSLGTENFHCDTLAKYSYWLEPRLECLREQDVFRVLKTVSIHRGHVFRTYPNSPIETALKSAIPVN